MQAATKPRADAQTPLPIAIIVSKAAGRKRYEGYAASGHTKRQGNGDRADHRQPHRKTARKARRQSPLVPDHKGAHPRNRVPIIAPSTI